MLLASDHPQIWAIQDQSTGQRMLGCGECLDKNLCGGLQVAGGGANAVDCLGLCRCENQAKCDVVCPKATQRYVRRLNEVHGFDLGTVPQVKELKMPVLPSVALLVEGNIIGDRPLRDYDYAAIPLSMAIVDAGKNARAKRSHELKTSFGLAPKRGWIATGVEKDAYVERMWRLNSPRKVYGQMVDSGVVFATTPNFSTMADVPRHDNLHAMKRIAWTWHHMMAAGLQTALHINGRTDHDFVRWAEFARRQPALRAVAFEFLTGAEPKEQGQRYVQRLKLFARESGRSDLLLVLRGGNAWHPDLDGHFASFLQIDSGPYFKTVKRQRCYVSVSGKPVFRPSSTANQSETRALFRHNATAHLARHAGPVDSSQRSLELCAVRMEKVAPACPEITSSQYVLFPDDSVV